MSAARKLEGLRAELERRFGSAIVPAPGTALSASPPGFRVGLRALDRLLPGGVPRGAVTLWTGEATSGRTAAMRLLAFSALAEGALVALVDSTRTLHAADWCGEGGREPDGLWIARPPDDSSAADGPWVAEHLLRSGVFGLVVLDGAPPHPTEAHRLRILAREVGAALLVSSAAPPDWREDVHIAFRRVGGDEPGLRAGGRFSRRSIVQALRVSGRPREGDIELIHVPPDLLGNATKLVAPDRRRPRG